MPRFRYGALLALLLSFGVSPALRAQNPWPDKTRVLPALLRQVPVGLTIWHTPNPNYPEPDSAQPGHFLWKHATCIRAEVGPLEVVECGSFIWYSEDGWQANMRLTSAEFATTFHCPGARLLPGQTYTFPKNYRYADSAQRLYGGDALWYILAKDAQGRLYKGIGLLETEATVLPTSRR